MVLKSPLAPELQGGLVTTQHSPMGPELLIPLSGAPPHMHFHLGGNPVAAELESTR